jgi:hypothetical protein
MPDAAPVTKATGREFVSRFPDRSLVP